MFSRLVSFSDRQFRDNFLDTGDPQYQKIMLDFATGIRAKEIEAVGRARERLGSNMNPWGEKAKETDKGERVSHLAQVRGHMPCGRRIATGRITW